MINAYSKTFLILGLVLILSLLFFSLNFKSDIENCADKNLYNYKKLYFSQKIFSKKENPFSVIGPSTIYDPIKGDELYKKFISKTLKEKIRDSNVNYETIYLNCQIEKKKNIELFKLKYN